MQKKRSFVRETADTAGQIAVGTLCVGVVLGAGTVYVAASAGDHLKQAAMRGLKRRAHLDVLKGLRQRRRH